MAEASSNAVAAVPAGASRIELVLQGPPEQHDWGALAWPLAAIVIVLLLRKPLAGAVGVLATRMKKFSLAGVEIELEAAAKKFASNEIDEVRDVAEHAAFADSSRQLKASLATAASADYAVVDLGHGREWLTSRLYFLACLATRMRKIRHVVFLHSREEGRQFVGSVPCDRLQWALARRYPWLEIAFARAYVTAVGALDVRTVEPDEPPLDAEGKITDPNRFSEFFSEYKDALQWRGPQPPIALHRGPATPGGARGWSPLADDLWERADWLTANLLDDILGPELSRTAAKRTLSTSQLDFTQSVMRATGDFLPVVDDHEALVDVVKRKDFVNRIVRQLADTV